MIGLVVMRGYPHSVIEAEAFANPIGLFQKREIERRLAEYGHSVSTWVPLGEDSSRPVRPDNPAFRRGLRLAAEAKSPIAIDNVLRLYDGATADSARALTTFLIETKYPMISLVHGKWLIHSNGEVFPTLLADRMHHAVQQEQLPALKAELGLVGRRKPPKATPETRKTARARNWAAANSALAGEIAKLVKDRDPSDTMGVAELCDLLNEREILTETGISWQLPNLRKKLKRLREEMSRGKMWDLIDL